MFPSSDLAILSGLSVSCSASCYPVCAGHSVCASFVAGLSRFPEGTVTVNKAFSSVVGWVPGQRPQPSDGCVLGSRGRVGWHSWVSLQSKVSCISVGGLEQASLCPHCWDSEKSCCFPAIANRNKNI